MHFGAYKAIRSVISKGACPIYIKNFVRIWRVVVKAKYRSIGLGVKLVQDTLHMLDTPYVEIMAVMANYNPFPEKAGMMRVPTESYINHDKGYLNALKKLQELGCLSYLKGFLSRYFKTVKMPIK